MHGINLDQERSYNARNHWLKLGNVSREYLLSVEQRIDKFCSESSRNFDKFTTRFIIHTHIRFSVSHEVQNIPCGSPDIFRLRFSQPHTSPAICWKVFTYIFWWVRELSKSARPTLLWMCCRSAKTGGLEKLTHFIFIGLRKSRHRRRSLFFFGDKFFN